MEWPHEGLMKVEIENEEENAPELERRKILPDESE